ncbi:flagellar export chaperone FliS [Paeniglutamicibacter sp. NPDC012692]|uniref:flagellar export chaperone FliS n=1 Tax=Paeniglutamicibacter sp. NPDC012692 TaxID=3364388 RepID=UPI0036A35316
MMMNPAQKRAQLNREAILSASPARLLTMLFDRLLLDLNRAEAAQQAQDWIAASDNLVHAQDIIAELVSSLNTESWDGAPGLQGLYAFATQTLVNANIRRDPALTRQAISLLEPLRQAWHEAAAVPAATPAIDGGTFVG